MSWSRGLWSKCLGVLVTLALASALAGCFQPLYSEAAHPGLVEDLRAAFAEAGDSLVHCFAPMMPHLAEECWEALGHKTFVAQSPWPVADRSLIASADVTYVVQVNGKKRGELTIEREADKERVEREALALDAVVRAMDNKPRRRVIIVPHRIVNVVV